MPPTAPGTERRTAFTSLPLVNIAAALVIVALLVMSLKALAGLLQPLFIAVFFFYLGRPLARRLVRLGLPNALANLAIIAVAGIALALLAWVIGAHVDDLRVRAPAYNDQLQHVIRSTFDWVAERVPQLADEIRRERDELQLTTGPISGLTRVLVTTFVGPLTTLLLVLFYLTFMNQETVTLPTRLEAAYGAERATRILQVGQRINDGIIRYVYVKVVASALVAILSTVAMLLFGLDLALMWGVLVFVGNFVPYLGSLVAVALPLVIAVLQFGDLTTVVALATVLAAAQVLVAYYVEPTLAGQEFNLSPMLVMFAFAFWGWVWGVTGLILAVPIMNAVKLALENIPATRSLAILASQASARAAPGENDGPHQARVPPAAATSDGTPGAPP